MSDSAPLLSASELRQAPLYGELATSRSLRFLITAVCNLRCQFCHNEFQGDSGARKRVAWSDPLVRYWVHRGAEHGIVRAKFSGGEPTLRWRVLTHIISLCRDAGAQELTLFSNLTLLTKDRIRELVDLGIKCVNANLPSFNPDVFAHRIGRATWPLADVLATATYLRSEGIRVQFNFVIPQVADEAAMAAVLGQELELADRHMSAWDALALVADDYAADTAGWQAWVRQWLTSAVGLAEHTDRPYRSHEFGWAGGRRILATRCTDWTRTPERAEADVYLVPPGVPLERHVRGKAYMTSTGAPQQNVTVLRAAQE